jgi:hypothetical protein
VRALRLFLYDDDNYDKHKYYSWSYNQYDKLNDKLNDKFNDKFNDYIEQFKWHDINDYFILAMWTMYICLEWFDLGLHRRQLLWWM